MTTEDKLTQCSRWGGFAAFTNPTPAERDAIALKFGELKAQQHAVLADEIEHSDGSREVRIHHYKTCLKCVGAR